MHATKTPAASAAVCQALIILFILIYQVPGRYLVAGRIENKKQSDLTALDDTSTIKSTNAKHKTPCKTPCTLHAEQ